jgi:hypothetical protein
VIPRVLMDTRVVLQGKPMDAWQLADAVHCHFRTAGRVLAQMHKLGQVHIVRWERSQGSALPVYALGLGEDAPRPVKLTDKERKARSKAKLSVEERDFASARRRQLRRKIKVDPLTAAFFGVR